MTVHIWNNWWLFCQSPPLRVRSHRRLSIVPFPVDAALDFWDWVGHTVQTHRKGDSLVLYPKSSTPGNSQNRVTRLSKNHGNRVAWIFITISNTFYHVLWHRRSRAETDRTPANDCQRLFCQWTRRKNITWMKFRWNVDPYSQSWSESGKWFILPSVVWAWL